MDESGEAFDFRHLYRLILDYEGDRLSRDVLLPRADDVRTATSLLSAFRRADGPAIEEDVLREGLWSLYALGRINDYLLLSFQNDERGGWDGPAISRDEYLAFFTAAGFTPYFSDSFSPFRHEIARVQPSESEDEPIRVAGTIWPGLMFGEMVFSRSGVSVSGGSVHVDKRTAEGSTLYFAHRRLPSQDQRPLEGVGQQFPVEDRLPPDSSTEANGCTTPTGRTSWARMPRPEWRPGRADPPRTRRTLQESVLHRRREGWLRPLAIRRSVRGADHVLMAFRGSRRGCSGRLPSPPEIEVISPEVGDVLQHRGRGGDQPGTVTGIIPLGVVFAAW